MVSNEQHSLSYKRTTIEDAIKEVNQQIQDFDKSSYVDIYDWQERYNEMLDEVYGDVTICGYTYDSSYALKEVDPIAYQCGKNDWLDSLDNDEFDEYKELVSKLEELESELYDLENS